MKFKIKATHYVDAPSWVEAEKQVEQGLSDADRIESEPLSKAPADIIKFGISSKIYEQHTKIYFDGPDDYEENMNRLRNSVRLWILNITEEIIRSNEQEWE